MSGKPKGGYVQDALSPRARLDLTEERYGSLLVLGYYGWRKTPGGQKKHGWRCRCDCGAETITDHSSLRAGTTTSCGCVHRKICSTHGRSKTKLYGVWRAMIQRCHSPSTRTFYRYGGRGITVCPEWRVSFEAFLADVGERPSDRHSLERVDNNGNYEPGNVVWATLDVQLTNTRTNAWLTHNGETLTVSEWGRRLGMKKSLIQTRLVRGWTVERALEQPVQRYRRRASTGSGAVGHDLTLV